MNKSLLCVSLTLTMFALTGAVDVGPHWWLFASALVWGAIGAEVNSLLWAKAQALAAFNWVKRGAE